MSAQVEDDRPRFLLPRRTRLMGPEPVARVPLPRVLLRRADAEPREQWLGVEEWRGLSPLGRQQADALVTRLGGLQVHRVLSSPSLRCRQTVVPLARSLEVEVEVCPELAFGAGPDQLRSLLSDEATEGAVLCTHREVLQRLFTELSEPADSVAGAPLPVRVSTAASWTLVDGPALASPALAPLG